VFIVINNIVTSSRV